MCNTNTCTHIHTHAHTRTHTRTHAHTNANTRTYIHTRTHARTYKHARTYARKHARTHTYKTTVQIRSTIRKKQIGQYLIFMNYKLKFENVKKMPTMFKLVLFITNAFN